MTGDATVVGGASPSDYVLESDEAAEFWQFLHGMRGDDLLVELIVNDLDAKSPRTVIRFEPERLVCAGAGLPVDQDGWDRLRKIRGAGGVVNAKKGLFGIKNHGLKACFTLGNDIILRSAGLRTVQTLFSRGANAPAYPGALRAPLYDPDGPAAGTTLEVPYRREAFRTQQGEAFTFSGMDDAMIDAKFLDAVATLPRRLLGIVRPRILERYTLELHHWRLGHASLDFRCGRWRMSKGAMAFARHCKVSASPGVDGADVFERGLLAAYDLHDDVERPEFYRAGAYRDAKGKLMFGGKGLVLEAAWPTDKSGALRHHAGRCRYPIAYPGGQADGGTGHDVWFSAPFSSDAARHALGAQSENWNNKLVGKCDDLTRRALSEVLLPQVGAPALSLIAGLADENRLKILLNGLLKDRSLPAVGPDRKPTRIAKGSMLLAPTYTWDQTTWSPLLAKVCPPGSVIVAPRTPSTVLARLSREGLDGWGETYHRFDEGDVSDRLRTAEAEHFPWPNRTVWRTALRDPAIAASHLDALEPALAQADATKRPKPQGVMLPDAHDELTPFEELRRGLALPDKFFDVPLPPVIHTALRDHRILRSPGWRLEDFTFTDLLHTGDLEAASLRAAAVGPLSATVVAEQTAPPEFKALLASLASEGSAKRLRKQLQERDLPHESLHVRWQKRLSDIHRVRVGVGLRAQFRLGRRTYAPQVEQAVVLDSHELWLVASDDPHAAFFGAIAEVIFAPPVKRYFADVLRAALAAEVRDFHRPTPEVDDLSQGRDDDADPDHTSASGDDDDQAETQRPHPGGEPDTSLNTPKPGPIYRGGTGRVRKPSKSTAPPRSQHVDEDVQRRELKQDHYAWHCQIELAKASPSTLSPAGSYAEFQENRSKLIEAHHPDKVGSGGPRNAGNLLILSHLNHERIGRAISRQQITDALKAECPPRSILAADGTPWVDGVVAHVQVPATGEVVGIFFTTEHRRYWLEMSGVERPL
jgi:hypothetical protein